VRVRLDRYASVTRWVAVKSWLLLVGGGLLLLTGLFSIFIAILMAATTTNLKEDRAMSSCSSSPAWHRPSRARS
jgi:UPF0716 family protein affecting phage T7 exclusion